MDNPSSMYTVIRSREKMYWLISKGTGTDCFVLVINKISNFENGSFFISDYLKIYTDSIHILMGFFSNSSLFMQVNMI